MVMAITEAGPVERAITGTRPGQALAGKFVAGDTLEEGVTAPGLFEHPLVEQQPAALSIEVQRRIAEIRSRG